MQVTRCSYYAYRRGKTYKESPLTVKIKECFSLNSRRYGSLRIAIALKIGRETVRKVLKKEGLRAIQPKSFKPKTTDSKHGFGFNENLLKDSQNQPQNRGEVFIGDITYLRLQSGKFENVEQARSEIFSYIEGYYDRVRLHSSLGYKSPIQFEKELKFNKRRELCVSLNLTTSGEGWK